MTDDANASMEPFMAAGVPLCSIHEINELDPAAQDEIYRTLLPEDLLAQFGIDPATLADAEGNRRVDFNPSPETNSVEIVTWHKRGAEDPLTYLQLADSVNNQLLVLMFMVNDPDSPRFGVDRDWSGERTKWGTRYRNLEAETAAMQAGLAPGQVRRGLRVTRRVMRKLELFSARLGHEMFMMEPLTYHDAIIFEKYGCAYSLGQAKMEWIDREFAPGGVLRACLDGSTPFRAPGAWQTVRGRSWAIHDGILGEPYSDARMYKRVFVDAGIKTWSISDW